MKYLESGNLIQNLDKWIPNQSSLLAASDKQPIKRTAPTGCEWKTNFKREENITRELDWIFSLPSRNIWKYFLRIWISGEFIRNIFSWEKKLKRGILKRSNAKYHVTFLLLMWWIVFQPLKSSPASKLLARLVSNISECGANIRDSDWGHYVITPSLLLVTKFITGYWYIVT